MINQTTTEFHNNNEAQIQAFLKKSKRWTKNTDSLYLSTSLSAMRHHAWRSAD
ncbi:hypothetical protein JCM19237_6164 [Photobacterium aphoticum]|uniref:Uncharacterized protein n=1 Tax=Photobacterium aphoticum TaxID=754436 RepID=A0A090QK23_9GAMM|nr:hypothetical protein JCM19237_6164 [Photobacterium aphoticum]